MLASPSVSPSVRRLLLVRGIRASALWAARGKKFCASACSEKGGKALIYGHRLTSGEADADDRSPRSGALSARQE